MKFIIARILQIACIVGLSFSCGPILVGWASADQAGSDFEKEAHKEMEQKVKRSPVLKRLDDELNEIYRKLPSSLREDQHAWLEHRNRACYGSQAFCEPIYVALYRDRIEAFKALESFDKSNETDRDAALELLKISINCKPRIIRIGPDDTITLQRSESTRDRAIIFSKTSGVATRGDKGYTFNAESEFRAYFKNLMLAFQGIGQSTHLPSNLPLSSECRRDTGNCIEFILSGKRDSTYSMDLTNCGDEAAVNARNAFNYLVLYARETAK